MGGAHQVAGIVRLADILDPDPEITAHYDPTGDGSRRTL
jgi:hypothetical protein